MNFPKLMYFYLLLKEDLRCNKLTIRIMNAIITGASKGIGKAIAIRIADEGFNIRICARHKEGINDLENIIHEKNPD